MAPAEEASVLTIQAEGQAHLARREARRTAIENIRPDATIRQKIKDGTALTAAEMARVLRWLVLNRDPSISD
jgi:hypothetical protein